MFDHLNQEPWAWTKADRRLSGIMSSYWVNFARSGNPNGQDLPIWPAYGTGNEQVLDLGSAITPVINPDLGSLHAFDRTYDAIRGSSFGKPMHQTKP